MSKIWTGYTRGAKKPCPPNQARFVFVPSLSCQNSQLMRKRSARSHTGVRFELLLLCCCLFRRGQRVSAQSRREKRPDGRRSGRGLGEGRAGRREHRGKCTAIRRAFRCENKSTHFYAHVFLTCACSEPVLVNRSCFNHANTQNSNKSRL